MKVSQLQNQQPSTPSPEFDDTIDQMQQALAAAQQNNPNSAQLSQLSSQVDALQASAPNMTRGQRHQALQQLTGQLSSAGVTGGGSTQAPQQPDALSTTNTAVAASYGQSAYSSVQGSTATNSLSDPATATNNGISAVGGHGKGHKAHHAAMAAAAEDLDMSPQDLYAAMQGGQSIQDLADNAGVDMDTINQDVTSALQTALPNASDQMLQTIASRILQPPQDTADA